MLIEGISMLPSTETNAHHWHLPGKDPVPTRGGHVREYNGLSAGLEISGNVLTRGVGGGEATFHTFS